MLKVKHDLRTIVLVDGTTVTEQHVPVEWIESLVWEKCPAPTMLGVALAVHQVVPAKKKNEEMAVFMMIEPDNGFAPFKWQLDYAGVLAFCRTDGQDLTKELFFQMHDYIFSLMAIYSEPNPIEAKRRLNPESFKKFVQQQQKYQDKN